MAFPLVLVMGCAFGAFMGLLIDALKIPAFIITLAGMFFLRGVSYLVSEESIPINHPVYDTLSGLAWTIPGGGRLSAMGLLMLLVVVAGILSPIAPALATGVCHRRQRHVGESDGDFDSQRHDPYLYALHRTGDAGRDRLFHLYPCGLCAGGRRRRAGCDCLGGDRRYAAQRWRRYRAGNAVRGGDPGLIQTYINFDGTLSSWWTKIAIGILLFIFIALQRGLTVLWENRQNAAVTRVSGAGSR